MPSSRCEFLLTRCKESAATDGFLTSNRTAGKNDERARQPGGEERQHDAPPQPEQQDGRAREHAVLPRLRESASERDGRAEDGPDGGGPGTVEERARDAVLAQAVEARPAGENEREGRRERDGGREQTA